MSLHRSAPLAVVGAGVLILALVRSPSEGDAAIGVWLAVVLPALLGAAEVGRYRRKRGRPISLGHYAVGAYAALAVIVFVAIMVANAGAETTNSGSRSTSKAWFEVSRRGAEYARALYAEADAIEKGGNPRGAVLKRREADEAEQWAYNADLVASAKRRLDTFTAMMESSMLGILSDPFAQSRANLREVGKQKSTFSAEAQITELGMNSSVTVNRGYDLMMDFVAAVVGSGIIGAGCAAMFVAGLKGRTVGAPIESIP